ncbi:Conserved_hypothetical protein [Hexamita inflata]|uniref:Uncharacterized protein n=1 Tax=Hexamita inflata TaxID=28002 RepID=A0AA86QX99_9EUKA|nr:Conserved hypothetical protein [Hexamita inflata]
MNSQNIVELLNAAMDQHHPDYVQANQQINYLVESCDKEYFIGLLYATTSQSKNVEFRAQAALSAKTFLSSKTTCVQILRQQVWKQLDEEMKQMFLDQIIQRLPEQQNQIPFLLSALINASDIPQAMSILDFLMQNATESTDETFRANVAQVVSSSVQQNPQLFSPTHTLSFVFSLLSRVSKITLQFALQILEHTAPYTEDYPVNFMDVLMKFLRSAISHAEYKYVCQVYSIFEHGLGQISIMQRQFEGVLVLEILLQAAESLIESPDELLIESILSFLCAVYSTPCCADIYQTQYVYNVSQILVQLSFRQIYKDSIWNRMFDLIRIVLINSQQKFRVDFIQFLINNERLKAVLNAVTSNQINGLINLEDFQIAISSFSIMLSGFSDQQENVNNELLLVIKNGLLYLREEWVQCVLINSAAQLIGFINENEQIQLLKTIMDIVKYNNSLNIISQASTFLVKLVNSNRPVVQNNLVSIFESFVTAHQHQIDSGCLSILNQYFIDEFLEQAFKQYNDLEMFTNMICNQITQFSANMNQQVYNYQQLISNILTSCLFNFAIQNYPASNNTLNLFRQLQMQTQTQIQILIGLDNFDFENLFVSQNQILAALRHLNQISDRSFLEQLVNFCYGIPQTELFISIVELLSQQFTDLTPQDQEKLIQCSIQCLYNTNSSVQAQNPCQMLIQKAFEAGARFDLNQIFDFIKGLFDSFLKINLKNTHDAALVFLLMDFMNLTIREQKFPVTDQVLIEACFTFTTAIITKFKDNDDILNSIQYANAFLSLCALYDIMGDKKARVIQFIKGNQIQILKIIEWLKGLNMGEDPTVFTTKFAYCLK